MIIEYKKRSVNLKGEAYFKVAKGNVLMVKNSHSMVSR